MIKLMHEDCIQAMRQLDEGSVDLTVTSPPYDNLRTYEGSLEWSEAIWKQVLEQLYMVTKKGGVVVWVVGDATIKGSETGTSFKQALYAKEIGFNLHDTMIYEKSGSSYPGSQKRYYGAFEYMFVFSKGELATANMIKDRPNKYVGTMGGNKRGGLCKREAMGRRFNIWRYAHGKSNSTKDERAHEHPAIFPDALAIDHIRSWSNEGDTVLDPFMGSGTTGIACKDLNRKFIGIEKVEKYFHLASGRIHSHNSQD